MSARRRRVRCLKIGCNRERVMDRDEIAFRAHARLLWWVATPRVTLPFQSISACAFKERLCVAANNSFLQKKKIYFPETTRSVFDMRLILCFNSHLTFPFYFTSL
jgi:hypothetical protein